jgi:mRNA interferase HigB
MRIVAKARLDDYAEQYPTARANLTRWLELTKLATWSNIQEVRATFPTADPIVVRSGKVTTCFNICGNDFRLITAIHYDRGTLFTMRLLRHAQYDKERWKEEL